MKILIAGAGIGGLTAALCLQKSGHEVTVLERSTEFVDVGAGIQCGANAVHVLAYLGLLDALIELAVEPERAEFRDYKNGKVLHSISLGAAYAQEYGAPYLHVHRADLHSILVTALLKNDAQCLLLNANVGAFDETPSGVSVSLTDGRTVEADLLVGADGVRSVVRDQLLGDHPPEFTGNVAWRVVVPADRLPQGWMDKVVSNFVGGKKHAVLYYLRNKTLVNLVGVVENKTWTDDSWVVNAPWSELKTDFAGWHPTVQAIIDAADKEQCFRWALYNHKPFDNWSSERVTLLGDAAHSTLPFMAAGAAMAIEDARILDRALAQAENVKLALQLYQANRLERTATIQADSTTLGKIYHLQNSLLLQAAFKGIALFGGKRQAYLPSYNANTVELVEAEE